MQLLGRVAGMTALLALCGGAARAQEASVPKASQPAAQETPKDAAPLALTVWASDEGPKINVPDPSRRGRGGAWR